MWTFQNDATWYKTAGLRTQFDVTFSSFKANGLGQPWRIQPLIFTKSVHNIINLCMICIIQLESHPAIAQTHRPFLREMSYHIMCSNCSISQSLRQEWKVKMRKWHLIFADQISDRCIYSILHNLTFHGKSVFKICVQVTKYLVNNWMGL